MSLKIGDRLGPYAVTSDPVTTDAGNCRWCFAERDGKAFFVKEFLRPKRPPEGLPAALREEKLARCRRFEDRYKALISAVSKVSAAGGNTVMPVDFFHARNIYFLIAPRIRTESLPVEEVARLPHADKIMLLRILARAIQTIHMQDIVHCDLKPSNILIQRTETKLYAAKLIDFDGSFFSGKPPEPEEMAFDQKYMAPEVLAYNKAGGATGGSATRLTTAADIFSLGILLHEYWTGTRPVAPDGGDAATAVANGKPLRFAAASAMPAALAGLIPRMLHRDPGARPRIIEVDDVLGREVKARATGATVIPTVTPAPAAAGFRGKLAAVFGAGPARPAARGFAEPPPPPITPPADSAPDAAPASRLRISKNLRKPK